MPKIGDVPAVVEGRAFDADGDVPFRPSPTLETMWASRRFDLDDYRFEDAVPQEK